jgi:hypothetical protein
VPPPVIASFTASPATINLGSSSSLAWAVTGATSVTLTGVTGQATSPVSVSPTATTTYTLTATNAGGTVSATATVTVNQPPAIASFTASPASITVGASSSLAWTITGTATSVTLTGITGQATSPVSVSPAATTTYTLTATNAAGTVTAAVTVTVLPAINSFTASSSSITAGQPVTLTWSTSGATSTQLSGVTASPVSPVVVYPSASTTYTLTATNASGSTTKSVAIAVTAATQIATATVGSTAGQLVPNNFMGLGVGESSYESVFGEPATGVNTVIRQIIRNITQYGAAPPTYKVTAYEQYPASAATYVPTAADVSALNQLYADLGVTFFVGVNLAADQPSIAVNQAQLYASQMTKGSLIGMEIGNEPDNYTHSSELYRTAPYAFLTDYAGFAQPVLSAISPYTTSKLVGPVWGQPTTVVGGSSNIVNNSGAAIKLTDFLTAQGSNLSFITQHGYANQCINGASYNTDFLLTPAAQNCISTSYLLGGVAPAHAQGLLYRIGEMNSITGGGVSGISNTFQAALWIMDWCAGLAKGGVDGVNIFGDSANQYYTMFTFNTSTSSGQTVYTLNYVLPQYYGVLMFQQATQNSAKFLPVTNTATGNQVLYAWLDASNTIRVLILNKDESGTGTVSFSLPTGYGNGTVTRLLESTPNATPAYLSTNGVTLGGQTFDTSTNGVIQGTAYGEVLTPTSNTYTIALPVTSAALITLPHN